MTKNIDREVAERFFGYHKLPESLENCTHQREDGQLSNIPNFCKDINEAWKLVKEIEKRGWTFSYTTMHKGERGNYITLGFLSNPLTSHFDHVAVKGPCFGEAVAFGVLAVLDEIEHTIR